MGNSSSKKEGEPLNSLPVCDKAFKVNVEYCGSCGYTKYFNILKNAAQKTFPNAEIQGKAIPGGTGCLEVRVLTNSQSGEGQLVHSKLKGDGTITDKNVQGVVAKIHQIVA